MTEQCSGDEESERLEGRYANYFEVGHNAFEFMLDFGQFNLESAGPRFHTRIVTSPIHAQAFSKTLRQSLDRFEQAFGQIPMANDDAPYG